MNRSTGILVLLAVASGCSSFQSGPDLGDRSGYSARTYRVPSPATPTGTENDRMKNYQYVGGTSSPGPMSSPGYQPPALLAAAPAPKPVDTGILPPPAPLNGTTAPAATAANTPSPNAPVQQASFQEPANNAPVPAALAQTSLQEPAPIKNDLVVPPPGKPEQLPVLETKTMPVKADDPPMPESKTDPVPPMEAKTVPMKAPLLLDTQPSQPASPAVRLVNSKRISVNYELKDVGPSGISGMELWYTQDGKTWTKREVSAQAKPPYIIEVSDEGLYGFTLLARNGIGLSKDPPKSGDLPQIWVEVDMTKPVVELTGIHANCVNSSQNVVVRWKASDKNLGPKPVTISIAESASGPWQVVAANVPNTGRYEWPLSPEAPARFHVKVEAADLVGNIGTAQTPKPVLMDRAQPTVAILTVEGGK
jgi:hypothetical protein